MRGWVLREDGPRGLGFAGPTRTKHSTRKTHQSLDPRNPMFKPTPVIRPEPKTLDPSLSFCSTQALEGQKYGPPMQALRPFMGILGTLRGTYKLCNPKPPKP